MRRRATRITVRVTPRAARSDMMGWDGDTLRVRVTAAPTDGKANDAVIALLSRRLAIPKASVTIVHGASARTKVVDIEGVTLASLHAAFQASA